MASFTVHGLDELYESISKATTVPDMVKRNVLLAMGNVISKALSRMAELILQGPFTSGITANSVKLGRVRITSDGGRVSVSFSGERTRANTTTRNAAIAFINEFGKRGQSARPFVKRTNEGNADAANEAGAKVFFAWLQKIGL